MKKVWVFWVLAVLLSGCGAAETFETVADVMATGQPAEARQISVTLPEESVLPAMESDRGTLYMCKGYDVTVMTLPGGDLDGTVRAVSGYGAEELTIIQSAAGELTKYEFVWTTAAEEGQQVCRAEILSDGNYHYVLTAMADADNANEYKEIWNGMFESFALV